MATKLSLTKNPPKTEAFSPRAVELMRAIAVREYAKGGPVTTPGEVFAILLGIGYKRDDEMDVQARASEFLTCVRERVDNDQVPSYEEVISVMDDLGYQRSSAT